MKDRPSSMADFARHVRKFIGSTQEGGEIAGPAWHSGRRRAIDLRRQGALRNGFNTMV
jgi:hypothetical protein